MQQSLAVNSETSSVSARRLWELLKPAFIIIVAILISGCGEETRPVSIANKPFAGVSLNLFCPDKLFAEILTPAARSWADRVGAKITFKFEQMSQGDDADLGIIDVQELGTWADRDQLVQVPIEIRSADHPFQWMSLLPAYREQLIVWGGLARAIPLSGDGFVIVYRTDRLKDPKFIAEYNAQFAHNPSVPTTWEEFAAIAGIFSKIDGKPSLPALTKSELTTLFFRIAACHDQKVLIESERSRPSGGLQALSFQFDLGTGKPRVTSFAFVASANWLTDLVARKCLPPLSAEGTSDPATALARNEASIGVLSLAQLARLPRENGAIPERFGLAALPGTQTAFDPDKQKLVQLPLPNYIPYFAGGRLGVVRTRCTNPAAAFDLLADLGSPTRSLEIIASTGLGAGPFRVSHLDHDRLKIWYGYGFDAVRSEMLRNALLQYVNQEVKNPAFCLRGPDQGALSSAAANAIGKIATGATAQEGLKQLLDDWNEIDSKTPEATRIKWRRLAAGLN